MNNPPRNSQSRHWVFTLNNYNDEDEATIQALAGVDYLVYGRETGEAGTPHLQGFISFTNRKRFLQVRNLLGGRAHVERMLGTANQAATYCKKDGDFFEVGTPPTTEPGPQWERVRDWALAYYQEHQTVPPERDVAREWPGHYIRYSRALLSFIRHSCPRPVLETAAPLPWQQQLIDELNGVPDDRTVLFYVDSDGGKGKTWLMRYLLSSDPDSVQVLSVAKRDDIAHAVDETKKIFLFNVPRGGMMYLQYTILEQLKDRMVFSPKYNSRTKILALSHVVVFCNEPPDETKMSLDRYDIRILE